MTLTHAILHLSEAASQAAPPSFSDDDVGRFLTNFAKLLGWLVSIALMIWIRMSGKGRSRTIEPQPFEVKESPKYASEQALKEHQGSVEKRMDKLEQSIKECFNNLDNKRSVSISNLHNHINGVETRLRDEVKECEGRIADRLKEGNTRMNDHDKAIAALDATQKALNKGGKP